MPAAAEVRFVPPESLLGEKWYVVVVTSMQTKSSAPETTRCTNLFQREGNKQKDNRQLFLSEKERNSNPFARGPPVLPMISSVDARGHYE